MVSPKEKQNAMHILMGRNWNKYSPDIHVQNINIPGVWRM